MYVCMYVCLCTFACICVCKKPCMDLSMHGRPCLSIYIMKFFDVCVYVCQLTRRDIQYLYVL
jgi:hypothetical protein